MTTISTIYRAPPNLGTLSLGRSLPSLLDEACDRYPNEQALNQRQKGRWQALSNHAFRKGAEEVALGLQDLGLQRGDRVAFVMHNDIPFCLVDMGCLLAGLVDVPIDLTQTIENILFILRHSDAKVLVVSNLDLLYQLQPYLPEATTLRTVVVADVPPDWEQTRKTLLGNSPVVTRPANATLDDGLEVPEECLQVPHFLEGHLEHASPDAHTPLVVRLLSLDELRLRGEMLWAETKVHGLRAAIAPGDLATILYIASETKRPKGVMLSHENISADILAAFSSFPNVATGPQEVALIFLPLTHIFARAFLYGHLAYGHSIYFSDPNHLVKHLKTINPTILITVPRLLEKLYERILDQSQRLGKFDQRVFQWALKLGHRYQIGRSQSRLFRLQLKLADRLVFGKWRAIFGDRMKALICGGAALRADLVNVFSAAGVPLLQGYGLTETSAVLCYNRGSYNRAGTVGVPIPGVEVALAEDGEILVRSPFTMQGYYRDPEATRQILEADGWLHTGDLGSLSADGFLSITGVKKNLFKLSTGKYVSPLPLEEELMRSPLVAQAVTVGANHKFCGMLIFPNRAAIWHTAQSFNLDIEAESWLYHPCLQALYHDLIDQANCHLPYWSTVRKFRLIDADLTLENGLLLPDGSVNRTQVLATFATEITALYSHDAEIQKIAAIDEASSSASPSPSLIASSCPIVPAASCPIYAKSLIHY